MTNQDNIDWAIDQFNQDRDLERLGKHLDSVEVKVAPEDNLIQRYAVLAELDRRIAFWQGAFNPQSAWAQSDIAKLATLRSLREFVVEMEGDCNGK